MSYDAWKLREPNQEPDWQSERASYDLGYGEGFQHGYESAEHDGYLHDGGPILFSYMLFGLSGALVGGGLVWWLT